MLDREAFEHVDWHNYWEVMHSVPRLFQLWVCKQTMSIAATNMARSKFTEGLSPLCPSCSTEEETCAHILKCTERGRVDALNNSIALLGDWLTTVHTEPQLRQVIVIYAYARGTRTMLEICLGMHPTLLDFARAQDCIGWRRFMEGMVARQATAIQRNFLRFAGLRGGAGKWTRTLMIKLMECTHGQWLYRNVIVHDRWCGTVNALRKELLLEEIEEQFDREEDLLPEDQYLMEINLGDINTSSGDKHEYWLLAVRAARIAKALAQETQGVG